MASSSDDSNSAATSRSDSGITANISEQNPTSADSSVVVGGFALELVEFLLGGSIAEIVECFLWDVVFFGERHFLEGACATLCLLLLLLLWLYDSAID